MTFTSSLFWGLLFLAVAIHWWLPRHRDTFLLAASVAFVAVLDWHSALFLACVSTAAYYCAKEFGERKRFLAVLPGIAAGLYLGYYKYLPPLLAQVTGHGEHLAEGLVNKGEATAGDVIVPLGASYFTFKLIHYVVECRRKEIPPHSLHSFLLYMFFMPMFTAGPIERFDDFLRTPRLPMSRSLIAQGGTRILYGLIKKFVVVDTLLARQDQHADLWGAIPLVFGSCSAEDLTQQLSHLHPAFVWQFAINHYVSWYFDFSAYTDIALGIALLFGIKLCENFDNPFASSNIGEFWKRYHMSLSGWCQHYVYFPALGATRNAKIALFASFTVMGLWHAGNLNYLAWGIYQGSLMTAYTVWSRYRRRRIALEEETYGEGKGPATRLLESRAFAVLGGIVTFLAVCASAAFPTMQAQGIRMAFRVFAALFGIHFG